MFIYRSSTVGSYLGGTVKGRRQKAAVSLSSLDMDNLLRRAGQLGECRQRLTCVSSTTDLFLLLENYLKKRRSSSTGVDARQY